MERFGARRDEQAARMADLGRRLTEAEWYGPTLCSGWQARHVFAHLTVSCTRGLLWTTAQVLRHRSVDRMADAGARALADHLTQHELLARFDEGRAHLRGPARWMPARLVWGDLMIHQLDVRRGLGLPEADGDRSPEDRRALLDLVASRSTPMVPASRRLRGLDLEATDVGWRREVAGGPSIQGRADDLVLAAAGRPAGLAGLAGDGVPLLARRIGGAGADAEAWAT
jgi:uncharacterized protein (TIGR03083 family)